MGYRELRSGICTHPPVGVSRCQDEAHQVQVSLPLRRIGSQLLSARRMSAYIQSTTVTSFLAGVFSAARILRSRVERHFYTQSSSNASVSSDCE